MSLSGRPVYDPNPLRPNPNPKKPMSGSCCIRGLGRTLTPLDIPGLTLCCFSLNYMQMIEEDIRTKEMCECVHDSLSYPIPYPIPGGTADFSDVLQEMCGVW